MQLADKSQWGKKSDTGARFDSLGLTFLSAAEAKQNESSLGSAPDCGPYEFLVSLLWLKGIQLLGWIVPVPAGFEEKPPQSHATNKQKNQARHHARGGGSLTCSDKDKDSVACSGPDGELKESRKPRA